MKCARWAVALAIAVLAAAGTRGEAALAWPTLAVPEQSVVVAGGTVVVPVTLANPTGVASISFRLTFDPASFSSGSLKNVGPCADWSCTANADNTLGFVELTLTSSTPLASSSEPIVIAEITLQAKGAAGVPSPLHFASKTLKDEHGATLTAVTTDGELHIVAASIYPSQVNFGTVYRGATVEGSLRLDYVREITAITKPDWASLRYQKATVYQDGTHWYIQVHYTVDTTQLGTRSGNVVLTTDQGDLTLPLRAEVKDPAEAAARVLLISAPFTAFATTDPATLDQLQTAVATARANVDYLEGDPRAACAPLPADLSVYDGILLSDTYLNFLRAGSDEEARLLSYARDLPDRRLVVFADAGWGGLVAHANQLLDPFGLHLLNVREEPHERVLTRADYGVLRDELTEGVEQITLDAPSPIDLGERTNALLRDPTDYHRAHAAVSWQGASDVVAVGFSSYVGWLERYPNPPNDTLRFFTNLLTFPPGADFTATPTSGLAPLTVQFTDQSTRGPTAWTWYLGDTTQSTEQNPSHTYAVPGAYDVWFIPANAFGADGDYREHCVLVTFADVPLAPAHWALDAILACSQRHVVSGYSDGTYRPDAPVDRGQMAVYISRAIADYEEVPEGPATATFSDVPLDHWAFKYVEYAADQGVVTGYSDDTYRPGDPVTRDQMAVYISRAIADPVGEAGLAGYRPPPAATFSDVPVGSWAYKHVEYARAMQVVSGYSDGTYRPGAVVTRDQMAVYVARAFDLL